MLKDAFNMLLNLKKRQMVYTRLATPSNFSATIGISTSNFGRNFEQEAGTVVAGFELVISKEELLKISGLTPTYPKRGDRIVDSEIGNMTVDHALPMIVEGGEIVGWRVRTT